MKHASSSTTFDIVLSPLGDAPFSALEEDSHQPSVDVVSDYEGDKNKQKKNGRREWHLRCDTFSEFEYWVQVFGSLTIPATTTTATTTWKPPAPSRIRLFK